MAATKKTTKSKGNQLESIKLKIGLSVKALVVAKSELIKIMKPSEAEAIFDKIIEEQKSNFIKKNQPKPTKKP